jgi:peptidoglycan/LPS O-acetylase OafA/YrhL
MEPIMPRAQSLPVGPSKSAFVGHRNNFDLLRLIAATAVILSHAYVIDGQTDPFARATGLSLGWSAVVMFFTISGFLIAQSLERRNLSAFVAARALRIFPGLAVCVFVTAAALAPLSNLPLAQYFSSIQTFKFVFGNATLLSTEYSLPGVFLDHRITQANGSIWTLRYELACYILLTLIYIGTVLRPTLRKAVVVIALIAGISAPEWHFLTIKPIPVQVSNLLELFMPFLVGSWIFWSNRRVTAIHVAAALIVTALLSRTTLFEPLATIAIAKFTLWIALKPIQIPALTRSRSDYSYGIYIYAYPIQQVISQAIPGLDPLAKALVAFLVVLVPACLSWHFVEGPSLLFKKNLESGAQSNIGSSATGELQQSSKMGTVP